MEYMVVASIRKYNQQRSYLYRCYSSETREIFDFTIEEINQLRLNGNTFTRATTESYNLVISKGMRSLQDWCDEHKDIGQRFLNEIQLPYGITASDINYSTNKKFKWKCQVCNKTRFVSINAMTYYKVGCPYCSGKLASTKNSLRTWCNNHGEFGARLAREIILPVGKTIDDISHGSNKKFNFKCEVCNKTYSTTINYRTAYKSGCPYCNKIGTSFPEQFIYRALKQIYTNTENRKKIDGFEIDIYVPQFSLCIEYNGGYYHSNIDRWVHDDNKKEYITDLGYKYINIEEVSGDDNKCTVEGDTIYFHYTNKNREERLILLIQYIIEVILKQSTFNKINFKQVISDAYKYSKVAIELKKSTAYLYPILLEEYKQELNANIALDSLSPGSHFRATWVCRNCGESWQTELSNRTHRKSGCPKCGFNIFTGVINKYAVRTSTDKFVLGEFSFLEEEYKSELNNNEDLRNYTYGSRKRINWKCVKCGYIWNTTINSRLWSKAGCPNCHRNIFNDNGYFRDEKAKERYLKQHPETFPIIDIVEENEV